MSGLPPFLAPSTGLDSGYMIAQVTAAALVSENKVLAHPASVDSIPSSAGKEDHVSMGGISSRKLDSVVDHVRKVLAIEAMVAAQGWICDFRFAVAQGASSGGLRQNARGDARGRPAVISGYEGLQASL